MDLKKLTQDLKTIAVAAGALEMKHYNAGTRVDHKSDGSPVTVADQEAEVFIIDAIEKMDLGIPIIAEESVAAGRIPDVSRGTYWLIDPLDGTKEFVNRTGEFTVNIALMKDFKPVLGVVYAPVIDALYTGYIGGDADMTIGGRCKKITVRTPPAEGITVVTSRSHGDKEELQVFLKDYTVAETFFRGSSLKICQIAAGEADLYPRLAPTCEWDIAAAHAVLNAAGGCLTHLDGSPMIYGKQEKGFLNPHFMVSSIL